MNKKIFTDIVKPLSMTSIDRISGLYDALEHIRLNKLEGDLVECGVWKGGNILGMIEYCLFHNMNKTIWLYDTFQGMTEPTEVDIDSKNRSAKNILQSVKCYCPLDHVKANIEKSTFPINQIKYIVGDVCETLKIKNNILNTISILRLDTDWYSSTKIELETLFPLLTKNGILIIDDYGHWGGCRKATDEYFKDINHSIEY